MIKIGVAGAGGRMGSMICKGVVLAQDMVLAGATEHAEHLHIGRDIGELLGKPPIGVRVTSDPAEGLKDASVIIDFSSPDATIRNLEFAYEGNKAMVIGTTGLSGDQRIEVEKLAESIPVVMASNMSIGVNVMFRVVGVLAGLLGDAYDCEIVEAHHRFKKDAPSGTAKSLASEIAKAKGIDLDSHARYERYGIIGERPMDEIGIQSVRAGDIVGDHTVIFAGNGERIELIHRAHSRETFASGALRAARWIADKKPGLYSMKDVLGL